MHTLRVGDLAFWDAFSAIIPCKVLAISGANGFASSSQLVTIVITADRSPYKRGETHISSALHVVPRSALKRRKYSTRIIPYLVESV